jgi:hypothetical protein
MFVNISRNKLLINKNRLPGKAVKAKKKEPRCNHCGGLVRFDGETSSCIMCSREKGHACSGCSFATQLEVDQNKKLA